MRLRTTRRVIDDPLFGTQPIAGIKKAQQMAQGAASTATGEAGKYGSDAESIGALLVPELTKEAKNPTGFNPTDKNAMLVAGEEGAGGATGAVAEEGSLRAARTHNTGALSGVLDEAARAKTKALSENSLGVEAANARLKEQQRQSGLSGLERVRGGDIQAQLHEQGLVPEDINAWGNAGKSGWLQNTLGTIGTLTGAAEAGKFIHG